MKNCIKFICMLAIFVSAFSTSALANVGHSNHYGKVSVTSNGEGSVYISTSNTATSGNTTETWNCGRTEGNDTKTFFLFAKPKEGYAFTGWSGDGSGTNSPYQVNIKAESTTEGNPTTFTYNATFKLLPTFYAKAVAVAEESKGNALVTFDSESITDSQASIEKRASNADDTQMSFVAYYVANALSGYAFTGWSETEGGDIISTENPYEAVITSTSNDSEAPTTKTLYANFAEAQSFSFRVTAQNDGNGFAYSSFDNHMYSVTSETDINSAESSVTIDVYFKSDANTGYALDYWEDGAGNRYSDKNPVVQLTNSEAGSTVEFTMTAHYKEYEEPEEPEPETPESEWTKYIDDTDPVPFIIMFGETAVTIIPNDNTRPYYVIAATESNNNTLWAQKRVRDFVANGGYTEVSNEAIWEWKLRDWAEQSDLLQGKQVINYKDFGIMSLIGTEDYSFVVAHCNGAGWKEGKDANGYMTIFEGESDAYRTSNFVIKQYSYQEAFHFEAQYNGGSYTDNTSYFTLIPSDEEQVYVATIINEKDRNGRTDMEIWEDAVASTSEENFMKGPIMISSSALTAGNYRIIAGGVVKENDQYVLYGDMLSKTWQIEAESKGKVTSVEVSVNEEAQTITVTPNDETGDYVAFLAYKSYYSSADAAVQDYINSWTGGGFFQGTQTMTMGNLKGYEGEGEYYLLVFGATTTESNSEKVFSKTQTTPYNSIVSITLGDMNNDGEYTISDLVQVISAVQDSQEQSWYTTKNFKFKADVNADKRIDKTDLELISKRILEK